MSIYPCISRAPTTVVPKMRGWGRENRGICRGAFGSAFRGVPRDTGRGMGICKEKFSGSEPVDNLWIWVRVPRNPIFRTLPLRTGSGVLGGKSGGKSGVIRGKVQEKCLFNFITSAKVIRKCGTGYADFDISSCMKMGFLGLSPFSEDAELLQGKNGWEMANGDSNFFAGTFLMFCLLSEKKVFGKEKMDSNNYTTMYIKSYMDYFPSTRVRARYGGTGKISPYCF